MSKKILSICLVFIISLTLMVPVCFAADDVDNWYNSLQPFDVGMYHQTEDGILYMTTYTTDGAVFSNPAKTNVEFVASGFIGASGGWLLSQIPQYDYYLNYIVCAYAESEADFSFYPNYYRVGYDVHGQFVPVSLEDVSFSHYDQTLFYGFSAVGRIPEGSYFGSPIRDITVTGSGSLPENIRVFVVMYQVPKKSDGTSADAAAIVSAIQDQTSQIITEESKQTDILQNDHTGTADSIDDIASSFNQIVDDIHDAESALLEGVDSNFDKVDEYMTNYNVHDIIQNDGKFYKHVSSRMFEALKGYQVLVILPLIVGAVVAIINASKAGRR